MNTKQLVALWLGGLAACVLLFAGANTASGAAAVLLVLAGIAVLTALAVYTFGDHPEADFKRVFGVVLGIPLLAAALVWALVEGAAWVSDGSQEHRRVTSDSASGLEYFRSDSGLADSLRSGEGASRDCERL